MNDCESHLNKQRNACIEDDRHEEGGYANIITKLSPFHMPEELAEMGRVHGMFWCISCKKTFLKKGATECPNCGSARIKPRAP